ncbi:MAG: hypothetical protein NDF55_07705 [archaeon GB-1867-005]|nr:hypothetical protein [Candidatus Culexmicrobium cathedralense]
MLIIISRQINLSEIYKDYSEVLRRLKIVSEISAKAGLASDEISKLILKLLAIKGALNISEIVREIKAIRGEASRKAICKRLKMLETLGILNVNIGWSKTYSINSEYQNSRDMITRSFIQETKTSTTCPSYEITSRR